MLHHILMASAGLIRILRKWLIRFSLIVFLLAMNVATLVSDTVYDMLHRIAWGTIELASDRLAERRPKTKAEIEAEASRARIDADVAKEDAIAANDEAAKLKNDLHASQREITVAKDRLREESTRNKSLTGELEVRDRRIAEMTADLDGVRKGRQHAIDAATSVRTRVVNSIRRDASTEAFEAMPFIGTGVFLGSIAYELNDACQQLRELEALDAALRGNGAQPITESESVRSFVYE